MSKIKAVDALSRRASLLMILRAEISGFDVIKDQYATDEDFGSIWAKCVAHAGAGDFYIHYGFLFKGSKLYIPQTSLRGHLVRELH